MITPQMPTNAQLNVEYLRQIAFTLNRSITNTNSLRARVVVASGDASVGDGVILADATSGPISIDLPAPAELNQKIIAVIKKDSSGNAVTLNGTINGASSRVLATQYAKAWLFCDGNEYFEL